MVYSSSLDAGAGAPVHGGEDVVDVHCGFAVAQARTRNVGGYGRVVWSRVPGASGRIAPSSPAGLIIRLVCGIYVGCIFVLDGIHTGRLSGV